MLYSDLPSRPREPSDMFLNKKQLRNYDSTMSWLLISSPAISFQKEMREVPAGVGCQSQQEHEPPKYQYGSHPSLVFGDAEFLRQDARARGKLDVQCQDLGHASERGVCSRQRIVGLAKFDRDPWTYMNTK